ncbi:DUF2157 domain-containing protein [Aureispira anguillae]|uniref:DUF2157 domain-containing protein n=1 Tax=Aureispira anguillae TaxID=2864201 RepID=A0A915YBL0_9BACT|nr:DUF2157 domain-containing protein [Aureispira anguillae]BDS10079.1 DUF2157 domain-containing protein [Aureispira anguillae]
MDLDTIDSHFQDVKNVENIPIDRQVLQVLAKHGTLTAEELQLTYQQSSLYPKKIEWLNIAYRFFMGAGLLLLLSGIVFFFAYNWSGLHKFAKLGLVESGIIIIGIALLSTKTSDFVLKLGLTAISVLVGVAFAVFGQIYQTGADAYDFFLGWTFFVTAWVAISSFPFLWIFYLMLINITTLLYFEQVQLSTETSTLFFIFGLLNVLALAIWEYVIQGDRKNWVQILCTRLIGVAIALILTNAVIYTIFDTQDTIFAWLNVVLYVGGMVMVKIYYNDQIRDIGFVTIGAISLLVIGNALVLKTLDSGSGDFIGIFLLLGIANIVVTVVLVMKLIQLSKDWNPEQVDLSNHKIEATDEQEK